MAKQPFTPDGVQALQKQLYALSDTDLQTQANEARSNLKSFITANFSFTTDELTYVNGLDGKFLIELGGLIATSLENRLSIILGRSGSGQPTGKLIHTNSTINIAHNSSGTTASGSLEIDISYQ